MAVQHDSAATPHEGRQHSSSKSTKRKLDSSSSEKPKKRSRKDRGKSAQPSSNKVPENQPSHSIVDGDIGTLGTGGVAAVLDNAKSPKKSKKRKKVSVDSAVVENATMEDPSHSTGKENHEPTKLEDDKDKDKKTKQGKPDPNDTPVDPAAVDDTSTLKNQKHRFILFIGNLPYTATTPSIETHFAKLKPASVRHPTDPSSRKSKGYAFLEFNGFDKMQTCLEKYHHSLFEGRKINVELTAGGGGKGKERRGKLKEKNNKLKEERQKWLEKERRAKEEKGKKGSEEKADKPQDGIHPSRRAMIKG